MSTDAASDSQTVDPEKEEEQRLQNQADIFADLTRQLLIKAGLEPGMKVLDLGSGTGDVALMAAELAGPNGSVIGIDANDAILETARRRAARAVYPNITFVVGDLRTAELDNDFDAIVSRFIFTHLPEPAAALRDVVVHLRPGGLVVAYESDFMTLRQENTYPWCPLCQHISSLIANALEYGGADMHMAFKLHQVFLDAGLEAPVMTVDALLGGSAEYLEQLANYAVETVRSLLPLIVQGGFATEEELEIDTLGRRLFDEATAANAVIRSELRAGVWARKPG